MAKGIPAERWVASDLASKDFFLSSRRHIKGPGDLLALQRPTTPRLWTPLLVEVKHTVGPYSEFGPDDREEMLLAAAYYGLEPLLAWVVGSRRDNAKFFYIPSDDWPGSPPTFPGVARPGLSVFRDLAAGRA